jgi:hypothetical protein
MIEANLGHWLFCGCVFGLLVYFPACLVRWVKPQLVSAISAVMAGAGIAAGSHLISCVWYPDHLADIVAKAGTSVDKMAFHLSLDGAHVLDVFVGGFAVIWVSVSHLCSLWVKPAHQ